MTLVIQQTEPPIHMRPKMKYSQGFATESCPTDDKKKGFLWHVGIHSAVAFKKSAVLKVYTVLPNGFGEVISFWMHIKVTLFLQFPSQLRELFGLLLLQLNRGKYYYLMLLETRWKLHFHHYSTQLNIAFSEKKKILSFDFSLIHDICNHVSTLEKNFF